jgi:hypothetical protein
MSEEEVILTVLNEVSEELKKANKSLKEMDARVKELEARIGEVTSGFQKLAAVVRAQPKPVLYRIMLFPETDYQGNYKTFIRWVIGGIVGMIVVGATYVLLHTLIQRAYPREVPASGMKIVVPTKKVKK